MRFLARTLLWLLLAVPVILFAVAWLGLRDTPSIVRPVRLTVQDIDNAKQLIERHDPRASHATASRRVAISESELELLLNYAASRLVAVVGEGLGTGMRGGAPSGKSGGAGSVPWIGAVAAHASLAPGAIRVQASAEIPDNPFGRYLNVDAVVREDQGRARVDRLRIGALPVPAVIADYALREALRRFAATERGAFATEIVKSFSVADGRVTLTYAWSGEIEQRARRALLPANEQVRLRAYHERLAAVVARAPGRVSVATLISPIFATALERGASGESIAENRAALLILALYANGTDIATIIPESSQWPRPAQRVLTLAGREDFAKHFLISAAIAAHAGSPLADAVGLHKEAADSRGGSGFSFNDIAADRAGTRLGEVASRSPERAKLLARALAAGAAESDFMPAVADLPEHMQQAEFERRFGGIDGPGYRKTMATIEARVASLPLLR